MKNEDATKLKLFPLGTVLFPGIPLPLHIFEDRYKRLVADCLDLSEPFGIVYTDDTQMSAIGCSARIEDIVRRYDDGKLDILTRGERKFRLVEIDETSPYFVGAVEYLDEDDNQATAGTDRLIEEAIGQLGRISRLTGLSVDFESLKRWEPGRISYLLSALDVFGASEKQYFLELPSADQRILACVRSMADIVKTYDVGDYTETLVTDGKLLHRFN